MLHLVNCGTTFCKRLITINSKLLCAIRLLGKIKLFKTHSILWRGGYFLFVSLLLIFGEHHVVVTWSVCLFVTRLSHAMVSCGKTSQRCSQLLLPVYFIIGNLLSSEDIMHIAHTFLPYTGYRQCIATLRTCRQ